MYNAVHTKYNILITPRAVRLSRAIKWEGKIKGFCCSCPTKSCWKQVTGKIYSKFGISGAGVFVRGGYLAGVFDHCGISDQSI